MDSICETIAMDCYKTKVIVCGFVENHKYPALYVVDYHKIEDVSAGYKSSNLTVNFSLNSVGDFVDVITHSQSLQFGFVAHNNSRLLFSPNVKMRDKNNCQYNNQIFSLFQTLLNFRPYDVNLFVQNFCCLDEKSLSDDYVDVCARLLAGTEYNVLINEETGVLKGLLGRINHVTAKIAESL